MPYSFKNLYEKIAGLRGFFVNTKSITTNRFLSNVTKFVGAINQSIGFFFFLLLSLRRTVFLLYIDKLRFK